MRHFHNGFNLRLQLWNHLALFYERENFMAFSYANCMTDDGISYELKIG